MRVRGYSHAFVDNEADQIEREREKQRSVVP